MTGYNKLGIRAKKTLWYGGVREPAVRCPACSSAVMPVDLLAHAAERCPGRAPPHPRATWLDWRDARALVPAATLNRLITAGIVRTRGRMRARRYLLRDIVLWLLWRRQGARKRRPVPPAQGSYSGHPGRAVDGIAALAQRRPFFGGNHGR